MPSLHALCDGLAELLSYPTAAAQAHQEALANMVATAHPSAGPRLSSFLAAAGALSTAERQELYTRTFDLNPACALEVGWHLFGEEYARGVLLVRLRALLALHGLPEEPELPDHLTHCLRLLGRLEPEEAARFARACVLPVLPDMLVALKAAENPYGDLLRAVQTVLEDRFAPLDLAVAESCHG